MVPITTKSLRPLRIRADVSASLLRWQSTALHLEIEKKIVLAPDFRQKVHAYMKQEKSLSRDGSSVTWSKASDVRMRDTYYDFQDQFSAAGLWVRRRSSRPVSQELEKSLPPLHQGSWEAKLRQGGDFIDSQFLEINGERDVQSLIDERYPRLKLDDLEVIADLETLRSVWTIQPQLGGLEPGYTFSVVLDSVRAIGLDENDNKRFVHEIAEIEITQDAWSFTDGSKESKGGQVEQANALIKSFIETHHELFTSSVPTGKLSAFFDWRERQNKSLRNS